MHHFLSVWKNIFTWQNPDAQCLKLQCLDQAAMTHTAQHCPLLFPINLLFCSVPASINLLSHNNIFPALSNSQQSYSISTCWHWAAWSGCHLGLNGSRLCTDSWVFHSDCFQCRTKYFAGVNWHSSIDSSGVSPTYASIWLVKPLSPILHPVPFDLSSLLVSRLPWNATRGESWQSGPET